MRGNAPIVVVGGGMAGLCTALAAAPRPVVLLSRAADGDGSASTLAQGGIAAAIGAGDSIDAHVADTLLAGAMHNDPGRVRMLAAAAAEAIEWLQEHGTEFDRDGAGLQLGREGGHHHARIVHAGGDASGARVMAALSAEARSATHIDWRSGVEADALVLRDGRVAGVRLDQDGRNEILMSSAVVLATGGVGALFARTTNPVGANGSGLALAMAAGAQLQDMEFVQFHPTALDLEEAHSLPLVTEALRGVGARLRDGNGKAIMDGLHPLGDLAPRDIVARRVWQENQTGGTVSLDARALEIHWERAFPTVLATCLGHGIDPRHMPIPVSAAAHFHMGGLPVDDLGRTSLDGLYAVGEVACNGVHGANRLASNSLLECVVFGRRLGSHLREQQSVRHDGGCLLVERGAGLHSDDLRLLRETLWQAAGPIRTAQNLQHGIDTLAPLLARGWQARLGQSLLAAALRRTTSIGAHWRDDAVINPVSRSRPNRSISHSIRH